jgi:hypothetical protein
MRRGGVASAVGSRQQGTGATDFSGGGTEQAVEAGEFCALLRREWAQAIFLLTRRGIPRDTRIITA